MNNDGKWKCPTCGVEADVKGREIHVHVVARGYNWPLHYDCELANDIDHIDFTKLERLS